MKIIPLILIYAVLLAVISPSQADSDGEWSAIDEVLSNKSIGLNTTELQRALMGKTKSAVKEFFGRKPDAVRAGTSMWDYRVSAMDPDSEKLNEECSVQFSGDPGKVIFVSFR